ncbi:MAG: glutamate 5-kinase, partial [Candidatus Diapherotrites archaeon]|nr:glutamate 5-kinase [Candidatus Diapherotrites archaeon]
MTPDKKIDHKVIARIARELSDLYRKGLEIVVISSGAVGSGREVMGFSVETIHELSLRKTQKIDDRLQKKLLAAIGQARLMQLYRESFDESKIPIAQLLLLREDFHNREKYLSIRTILEQLVAHRVIPILNENDPLAPADLCFSDNDNLAALVAVALKADHLVILSDTPGLYNDNPSKNKNAQLIPVVREITPEIKSYCSESVSGVGVGGMINKIMAIEMATRAGISAYLVYGQKPG